MNAAMTAPAHDFSAPTQAMPRTSATPIDVALPGRDVASAGTV